MSKQTSRKRPLTPEEVAECVALKAIWMAKKKELGLTQDILSDRLGMTQAGINWEASTKLDCQIECQFADDSWFLGAGMVVQPREFFGRP